MQHSFAEGRYANAFFVGFNAFEFVLDFGQRYSEHSEVNIHSRIVTSPVYARMLVYVLSNSVARYDSAYGDGPEARRTGQYLRGERESFRREAHMPEQKNPYGPGLNEVGLPGEDAGGEGEAFGIGDITGAFNKIKKHIIDDDNKIVSVVVPWLRKVVSQRLGATGEADPFEMPNSTPITAMIPPSFGSRLSPAVKRLTRGDLLALGGWGVARKLPQELGLSNKDIQTIRDLFSQKLTNPSSFEDEAEAWSVSCCSCTPCCCAAAVIQPLRQVS